jgi:hypothetical protein
MNKKEEAANYRRNNIILLGVLVAELMVFTFALSNTIHKVYELYKEGQETHTIRYHRWAIIERKKDRNSRITKYRIANYKEWEKDSTNPKWLDDTVYVGIDSTFNGFFPVDAYENNLIIGKKNENESYLLDTNGVIKLKYKDSVNYFTTDTMWLKGQILIDGKKLFFWNGDSLIPESRKGKINIQKSNNTILIGNTPYVLDNKSGVLINK